MEQITITETLKDIKIQQLEKKIEELKKENLNLKQIIMYQSYERAGIKSKAMQLKKDS